MSSVGAILLAAGASTRLGRPKQLVRIGAENLLERAIRVVKETPCSPILVVLGASADVIRQRSRLDGVQEIFNPGWQEGMAGSIRLGMDALPEVEGVILIVCDMPAVTPEHTRALAGSGKLTASSYAGRRGVPAYLPRSMFSALRNLQGDTGARGMLRNADLVELPGGELDIDTEEDVRIAQRLFA